MLFDTGLSTTSAIALAVMAGIFIVFALLSSFVFPKRNPDFPGKKWRWGYVLLSVVLFALMMSTVVVFGKEDEEANAEETAATHPGETSSTETTPAPNTNEEEVPPEYANGDAAAGKVVFTQQELRHVPHAGGGGRDRHGRPEPRRDEALRGADRRPRRQRQGRDAAVRASSPTSRSPTSSRTSTSPRTRARTRPDRGRVPEACATIRDPGEVAEWLKAAPC